MPGSSAGVHAATGAGDASATLVRASPLEALRQAGRALGDAALLAQVVQSFCGEAAQRLVRVRDALVAGDLSAVGDETHALRGTAAQLGADPLAAAAAQLEARCEANDLHGARACFPELDALRERTCAALQRALAEPA